MRLMPMFLTLSLAFACGLVHAKVEVYFLEPDKYIDLEEFRDERKGRTLPSLAEHLEQLGAKYLPGKDLVIKVVDVNLAGVLNSNDTRTMTENLSPEFLLLFMLSEGGREIRRGEVRLTNPNYIAQLRRSRYLYNDPLRYEKRMLEDWFIEDLAVNRP